MTRFEITSTVLTVIGVILIPVVVILIRGAIKWTRTEDRLSELVADVRELVIQGREDRAATNQRLRYIEEWFMSTGRGRRPRG